LTAKDAAIRFGRQEEFCDYAWAHESTHGSEAASVFSTRIEGDTTRLHARTGDASVLGAFAFFVARAMADAAAATYSILGWTPVPDFDEPVSVIEWLMKEHHRPA
jgi:hypothetical protein